MADAARPPLSSGAAYDALMRLTSQRDAAIIAAQRAVTASFAPAMAEAYEIFSAALAADPRSHVHNSKGIDP